MFSRKGKIFIYVILAISFIMVFYTGFILYALNKVEVSEVELEVLNETTVETHVNKSEEPEVVQIARCEEETYEESEEYQEELFRKEANIKRNYEIIEPLNEAIKGLELYGVREFKFINIAIDGWTLNWDYQKICYDKANGNFLKFILYLSHLYREGSRNRTDIVRYNDNGTWDTGIAQVNSSNANYLKKYTPNHSTDTEYLKDPRICIYVMADIIDDNIEKCNYNYFESLAVYNGGLGSVLNMRSGEWTHNCVAGKYAKETFVIMNILYNKYDEEII